MHAPAATAPSIEDTLLDSTLSHSVKTRRARPGDGSLWLLLPIATWLAVFTLMPLAFLLLMSFWKSSIFGLEIDWNLENYANLVQDRVYIDVLVSTIRISALTTIASILIGYPVAWAMASATGRRKGILLLLVFLPFWTSYLIRTFAWLPILGRTGVINTTLMSMGLIDAPIQALLYNESTVYLGLLYVYILYMILPIYLSLEKIDRSLFEAASDLGANGFQLFRRVVLPLSLPGIVSGSVMVFLLCCGAYVTPQLLGGPSAIMFGNLIANQFIGDNNWAFGSALSIAMMVIVLGFVFAMARIVGFRRLFLGA